MSEVEKMPPTNHTVLEIEGVLSSEHLDTLLSFVEGHLGCKAKILDDDELVSISDTAWYDDMEAEMSPGEYVRLYRENHGWTQLDLGSELGGVSRHRISDIETGKRSISKEMAKKLCDLFSVSIDRFL